MLSTRNESKTLQTVDFNVKTSLDLISSVYYRRYVPKFDGKFVTSENCHL